jgi:hypothetical protein
MLLSARNRLLAEEDTRLLEVTNFADYKKETQRKILKRLEKGRAQAIDPAAIGLLNM